MISHSYKDPALVCQKLQESEILAAEKSSPGIWVETRFGMSAFPSSMGARIS